ncbi:hypothetical protein [Limosilactobacillus antri]|uniref:Uncharacterized protein n=1 Tax=Limosilactobacillus antri DSM 16041 TaxID=525309 RepID=C8P449_9LACO|nr:hypothetical protein [Limosilactobacillus antri]EEW54716.1 hypothetical protein HMPREF0494_0093 [Limosilactobacillus antri DSM 16041]KRK60646.1 hypothetical protein FC31_GL000671 [Limosilactobacillus antri DSM 16041]
MYQIRRIMMALCGVILCGLCVGMLQKAKLGVDPVHLLRHGDRQPLQLFLLHLLPDPDRQPASGGLGFTPALYWNCNHF